MIEIVKASLKMMPFLLNRLAGRDLKGFLFDQNQKPIAGALVCFDEIKSCETFENGSYSVRLTNGTYCVSVEYGNHTYERLDVLIVDDKTSSIDGIHIEIRPSKVQDVRNQDFGDELNENLLVDEPKLSEIPVLGSSMPGKEELPLLKETKAQGECELSYPESINRSKIWKEASSEVDMTGYKVRAPWQKWKSIDQAVVLSSDRYSDLVNTPELIPLDRLDYLKEQLIEYIKMVLKVRSTYNVKKKEGFRPENATHIFSYETCLKGARAWVQVTYERGLTKNNNQY